MAGFGRGHAVNEGGAKMSGCFRRRSLAMLSLFSLASGVASAQPAHDSCTSPLPLCGSGVYTFDNTAATTSPFGQNNPNCADTTGNTAIEDDLFFCWTADCTGSVTISTCGQTSVDTKIAIYRPTTPVCACPSVQVPPAAFCCNDDGCTLQSIIPSCEVVCGDQYVIQIGNKFGNPSGTGTFTITCNPATPGDSCPCLDEGCCLPDGTCANMFANECIALGGTPLGTGVLCSPPEACCADNGSCVMISPECCTILGGSSLGVGSACLGDIDGDGHDDACSPHADCAIQPGTTFCPPTVCPIQGEFCQPTKVIHDPIFGTYQIIECDCQPDGACHIDQVQGAPPFCVNSCPSGQTCDVVSVDNGDGTFTLSCDCLDPCQPLPAPTYGCSPTTCPGANEICRPISISLDPLSGQYAVTECDCSSDDVCHVDYNPAISPDPFCVGSCIGGLDCELQTRMNTDGTTSYECDCVGVPSCGSCCGGEPLYTGFPGPITFNTIDRGLPTDFVVNAINLSGQGAAPIGSPDWITPFYNHPTWTRGVLGSVFGITIDNLGNAYVTHTSSYGIGFGSSDVLGTIAGCGPGAIYRLDAVTGVASCFQNLPNTLDTTISPASEGWPGLGNIAFSCPTQRFYVSNFSDGRIYLLNGTGVILGSYDHATGIVYAGLASDPFDNPNTFAPLGERVWAVQPSNGRLYYSIWWEDMGRQNAAQANEIWSIGLAPNGDFIGGSAQLEITLPDFGVASGYSNPVADITFNPLCCMLVAERSMINDTSSWAHASRVLEYCFDASTGWTSSGNAYLIGNGGFNSAGGIDYDFHALSINVVKNVWVTGDLLIYYGSPTNWVYGITGLSSTGGNDANSIHIDSDLNTMFQDKFQQGDVEVTCPDCSQGAPEACCLPGGICQMLDPLCCQQQGGNPLGTGTICLGDLDGDGVDDACQQSAICEPIPGVFGCTPVLCPDPTIEKCIPDKVYCDAAGNCFVVSCDCESFDRCQLNFDAANNPYCTGGCPIPGLDCKLIETQDAAGGITYDCDCIDIATNEACCLPDGSCQMLPPAQCAALGGVPLGAGSACLGVEACCYIDPQGLLLCQDMDALCCLKFFNGSPQGAGNLCLGDSNGNGVDDQCEPPACTPPPPGVFDCPPVICPSADEKCQPKCVDYDPLTGQYSIAECDCSPADQCHIDLGPAPFTPHCVGPCPQGQMCQQSATLDPLTGIERICCNCVDDPPDVCEPTSDLLGCTQPDCGNPNKRCQPHCVHYDPATGQTTVTDCDCTHFKKCHAIIRPAPFEPTCDGKCPPGRSCIETRTYDPLTGGYDLCCDCVDVCPLDNPTADDPCAGLQTHDCINGGPNEVCTAQCIQVIPGPVDLPVPYATECTCSLPGECGPVEVTLDADGFHVLSCPGDCYLPEVGMCQIFLNGVPQGVNIVIAENLPIGSIVKCDCAEPPVPVCPTFLPAAVDICGPRQAADCQNGGPNEFCVPTSVHWDPNLGTVTANKCECQQDVECRVNPTIGPVGPTCTGVCPQTGDVCTPTMVVNPNGGFDVSCDCCQHNDISLNLATGINAGGGAITIGNGDDNWVVTGEPPPVGILPRPATVINAYWAWLTIPGSQWISANATGPSGTYTYEYCWCMAETFQNASLWFQIRADDVATVFLNGNNLLTTPPSSFLTPMPIGLSTAHQPFFQAGTNCLTVRVTDTHQVVTGMDLVGQVVAANAQCCCEPEADGSACKQSSCANSAQKCHPTKVVCQPGVPCQIVECDCVGASSCHVDLTNPANPTCVGGCQVFGQTCLRTQTANPDGSTTTTCGCGIICDSVDDCHDLNVCTCDKCITGGCENTPNKYGNADCSANQQPNLDDILCVLGGFSNYASCVNGDIHPACTGNEVINLDDILFELAAFAGQDPCGCP